jgi:hypothetical protein
MIGVMHSTIHRYPASVRRRTQLSIRRVDRRRQRGAKAGWGRWVRGRTYGGAKCAQDGCIGLA